ncbi:hypothetical protein FB157_15313 [Streptomyces sp. BK340]|nr:hypothetical protein FB157_15313 [Streptomyces sp. BK340]
MSATGAAAPSPTSRVDFSKFNVSAGSGVDHFAYARPSPVGSHTGVRRSMSAGSAGSADPRDQPGDRTDQLLQQDQPHHQGTGRQNLGLSAAWLLPTEASPAKRSPGEPPGREGVKPLVGLVRQDHVRSNQRLHVGRPCCRARRPTPHRGVPRPGAGHPPALDRHAESALPPQARSARRYCCCAGSENTTACTAWARDAGISPATSYHYLHEGSGVPAGQAPDLHEVLDLCRAQGMTNVVLDGTLIASDRLAGVRENGNAL